MKILIIAPHPDDEVLGCGGAIAKHAKSGDEVHLCIVTKGYTPDWPEEILKEDAKQVEAAGRILGIKETHFLGFPAVKLDTVPQKELNDSLIKIVEKIRPDVAYIPHRGDLNMDHRIVFDVSLVALRPIGHKVKRILSYETLSETEWGRPIEQFVPNYFIDITETFGLKIEAMKAYATELKEQPHPRSLESIEAMCRKRGSEISVKYAESFFLIREIVM